jgi:hypothetical protein
MFNFPKPSDFRSPRRFGADPDLRRDLGDRHG